MGKVRHIALVVVLACGSETDGAQTVPPATQSGAAETGAVEPALTDAQIAAIVVAANAADADLGEFAAARAANEEVKSFAAAMVRDHRAVNEQAGALVGRLGVTPEENDVSRGLVSGGAEARAQLGAKSGAEFDRAYIAHEVAYHEAVIRAVDETLLPNASNAELKQAIANVRPALVAHLEHARHLQAKLQ